MSRINQHLSGSKIRNLIVGVSILVSALTVSAQQDGCSDLNIKSTDGQFPWHPFEASLVLTEQQRAVIRDIRWTITKHNTSSNKREVETVRNALSVETRAWDANEPGYIQWLVVGRVGDCVSAGISSSTVYPNPGSPLLIDEFGNLPENDQKGRLDLALAEVTGRHRNEELIIFADFPATTSWKARRVKVKSMLDHMVGFRKFDASRITFVLSEGTRTNFRLQPVPPDLVDVHSPSGSLVIPGERFNDFVKFFK
ncbi:MAG: hypothetical protein ABL984_07120 [Pyrinomonadaceae bacterium]